MSIGPTVQAQAKYNFYGQIKPAKKAGIWLKLRSPKNSHLLMHQLREGHLVKCIDKRGDYFEK